MKNKTAFLPIYVSVFNCGFPNEQIRFGKAIYLLPVPIGSLLFVLLARRFCARGDGMPPCCLATGRWGAARRRLDTQEIARDPAPCPLPPAWSYEESTGWHDENKFIITETSLCPGHEWLAIVVLWFIETCSFLQQPLPLLNKETVQEMVRTTRRIGLIKIQQVVICEKKFFCSLNFFCEKFPIKHCSTHNM